MKRASILLPIVFLSSSLVAYGQQPVAKPDTVKPAPADGVPAPAGAQLGVQLAAPTACSPGSSPVRRLPQPEPAPVQDLDPNYILGTDDAIMVHVWKEPTISGPLLIRPDTGRGSPCRVLVGDLAAARHDPDGFGQLRLRIISKNSSTTRQLR